MHYGIIAAGEGSRLVQEGIPTPKPLVEINGVPMIKRLIDIFIENNAESLAIIINEEMKEVKNYLEELQAELPVNMTLIVKSTPGSMHSFYHLANCFKNKGRFILTTVDTIFNPSQFSKYANAFHNADEEIDAMMAVTSFVDDEKPLYISTDDRMNITAFSDTRQDDTKFISGGIYGLDNKATRLLDRCMQAGIVRMRHFQRALIENHLNVKAYNIGKIIDVDHADDIKKAEEI